VIKINKKVKGINKTDSKLEGFANN